MKLFGVLLMLAGGLLAQPNAGSPIEQYTFHGTQNQSGYDDLVFRTYVQNGVKTLSFSVYHCTDESRALYQLGELGQLIAPGLEDVPDVCKLVAEPIAENYSPVQELVGEFLSDTSDLPHKLVYGALPNPGLNNSREGQPHPLLTLTTPTAPADPRIIFLDGLGNSLIALDPVSLKVVSQVVVPSTSGPFGIRPAATGPDNEVWVVNGGIQVSVADLGTQQLVTNISTSSIPAASQVAGIVFTNDGLAALEAVRFLTPDSSGNKGALLIFDTAKRQLVSTMLLKTDPTAILMAPDGLTAYLLSSGGAITYYDVLSGTADLTLSTFTPGVAGGYGPPAQVYAHPDGTRLFWNNGVNLIVFDLTAHKIVNQFPSSLPTTAFPAMTMSQDGAKVYFSNALGDVAIVDTRYGNILIRDNLGDASTFLAGPPVGP